MEPNTEKKETLNEDALEELNEMEDVSDSDDQKNNQAIDGITSDNNDMIPILDETPSLENINEEDKVSETNDSEENSDQTADKVKESNNLSQQQEGKNETSNLTPDNEEDVKPKSNSKILIIVVLSLLLILDLAALIIYLIGIDKVISFIK